MKVVECSDKTYDFICEMAAGRKASQADTVDWLVHLLASIVSMIPEELLKEKTLQQALKETPKEPVKRAKIRFF